jgi:hypothetical protein
MSHESTIAKTPKFVLVLLALTFVACGIGTLIGLFNFNNEKDTVALAAVQKLTDKPVRIDVADEQDDLYVSDGEKVWVTKMVKVDGQWKAQNIEEEGTFK